MKEGWKLVPLKEVCLDFIVPQRDKPTAFDGDIPWCRIEDIEGRYLNGSKSGQKVTKALADKMNMHLCPKGTVISACSASIGNQAITTTDCYTNQTFIGLVVNPNLLYNVYLYFFLESQTKSLLNLGQGATIKYISKDKYKSMLIPLPSIEEQQRIVSRLDSAFAHIDELKANAEKQLSEASTLFQKALTKAMEPKEGWEEKTLGELATDMYRGSGIKRDQVTSEGIPCVRYGEIYTTYNIGFEECVSHTKETYIPSPKYFEHGDLLFAITGESVEDIGKTIAYLGHDKCLLGGDIICMKHQQNPKFMAYALSTPDAIRQKGIGKTKLKVVHTNAPALKAISIPLPTLSEQQRIVSRLDSLSAYVRELEEVTQKTIAECDALKQALLRKVFE